MEVNWADTVLAYLIDHGYLVWFYLCVFNQPSCIFCMSEEVKRKPIL